MLTKHVAAQPGKGLEMERKRSGRIILTNEARVLRELRLGTGLSMRKAGELFGLSDSYIAHLETGRMDVPTGERLQRLLDVYGGMKAKSFYERVRNYSHKQTPREELSELVRRANDEQTKTLLSIAKGILANAQ
jgi:transcriptional regulator with XRE-family HTH domain